MTSYRTPKELFTTTNNISHYFQNEEKVELPRNPLLLPSKIFAVNRHKGDEKHFTATTSSRFAPQQAVQSNNVHNQAPYNPETTYRRAPFMHSVQYLDTPATNASIDPQNRRTNHTRYASEFTNKYHDKNKQAEFQPRQVWDSHKEENLNGSAQLESVRING